MKEPLQTCYRYYSRPSLDFSPNVISTINQEQLDIPKFVKYFTNFSGTMKDLEQQFHPNKVRLTKYLRKIDELFQEWNSQKNKISTLQSTLVTNYPPKKPAINFKHSQKKKQTLDNVNMNSIQQTSKTIEKQENKQQQKCQVFQRTFKRRSQTAGQNRKKISLSIDYENDRPRTGKIYSRQKNQRYSKYTINPKTTYSKISLSEKASGTQLFNNFPENQIQRKSLYDELQSEKSYKKMQAFQFQSLPEQYLQRSSKKKKQGFSRWSFKINKLL